MIFLFFWWADCNWSQKSKFLFYLNFIDFGEKVSIWIVNMLKVVSNWIKGPLSPVCFSFKNFLSNFTIFLCKKVQESQFFLLTGSAIYWKKLIVDLFENLFENWHFEIVIFLTQVLGVYRRLLKCLLAWHV